MCNKNRMLTLFKILFSLLIIAILLSCENRKLGITIPGNLKPTSYELVKANPKQFVDSKIVLKGTVGPFCCSGKCKLTLKTGSESVAIYPGNFKFTNVETGRPVKLYVQVVPGEKKTVINALGVEFL